jgi:hypothetical protein
MGSPSPLSPRLRLGLFMKVRNSDTSLSGEPRTPDTLKSAPDQRIQSEGRTSQERTVGEKDRALDEKRELKENRNDEKK